MLTEMLPQILGNEVEKKRMTQTMLSMLNENQEQAKKGCKESIKLNSAKNASQQKKR